MAIVYFDSSAFVKLLVEEEGTTLAAALWDGCDAAVSSRLSFPEVCAALAAAARAGRLSDADWRRAEADWKGYWAAVRPVELTEAVSTQAGLLAGKHALRGADAVHVASLLAVGVRPTLFAVWDKQLRRAARAVQARLAPVD